MVAAPGRFVFFGGFQDDLVYPETHQTKGCFRTTLTDVSYIYIPWKSKTKQRMVFGMIHVKDSLLPMGKVRSLDFLGIYYIYKLHIVRTC